MEFSLRPLTAADIEGVFRLNRRVEEHDSIPIVTPLEEFEDWLHDPHFDLTADARVAVVEGALVGWARIWHRPSGEREERAYLLGAVDPDHRGRGIGTALFTWQRSRAEEKLEAVDEELPRYLRAQAYDFEESALQLYERQGMAVVRYQDELLRTLADLPPLPHIDGITIIPWDQIYSEQARLVNNDAFADHWGSTPRDQRAWEHDLAASGSKLDLSFLALDHDQVVGLTLNAHFPDDQAVTGRLDGWIFQLSVASAYRGRGIASGLIISSLHAFKDASFDHAALGVDSENLTGAYRLYERLGFRRMTRSIVHQIRL
ncbi:MAG TPA: GNAT family N-acetyltransferase [Acidimicrobiia bacterium]|nr:GNAT family N-acetyltransferase [Acidimicrobiia bacterium]